MDEFEGVRHALKLDITPQILRGRSHYRLWEEKRLAQGRPTELLPVASGHSRVNPRKVTVPNTPNEVGVTGGSRFSQQL